MNNIPKLLDVGYRTLPRFADWYNWEKHMDEFSWTQELVDLAIPGIVLLPPVILANDIDCHINMRMPSSLDMELVLGTG